MTAASITVIGAPGAASGLDATIEEVLARRREQRAAAARVAEAGLDTGPVEGLLQVTEAYLGCLRQTRAVLAWRLPS